MAARLLHKLSDRAAKPFVPINCGGLSEALIESELFGHEQGAFTGAVRKRKGLFEVAQGGVLLLDEIHAMSPRLQASLLRVLESGEIRRIGANHSSHVDVRVLAAANETLDKAVAEGSFRQDLYYRLNQLRIDLPPLRERPEDIRPLVTHFLDPLFDRYEVVVSDELIQAMQDFDWPGNVRQLKHAVSRMALMAGDRRVLGADLFDAGRSQPAAGSPPASRPPEKAPDPLGPPPRSHDTLQRRRYVTDMFQKHKKLTRAQIIRKVGCAPNTATRDLQHLQQEGLIRRVETSRHLRTSYFQWIGTGAQA